MPLAFQLVRTKTGVVDDATPNATAPVEADLLVMPERRADVGTALSQGWYFYLVFLDAAGAEVAAGTASVAPWIRNDTDKSWSYGTTDLLVANRALYRNELPANDPDVYFRLTTIAGAGVASVKVYAAPL